MHRHRVVLRSIALQLAGLGWAALLAAQQSVSVPRSKIDNLIKRQVLTAPLTVTGHTRTDTVSDTQRVVRLAADQYLAAVVARSARPDTAGGGTHLDLPIRYVRPDANGDRADLHLIPVVDLEGGGLGYEPETQLFRGSLLMGVEDSVQPTVRRPLNPPIALQLTTDAGTIEPSLLEVRSTNIPFLRVALESRAPGDSITVRVRPEFTPQTVTFRVPVRRPRLQLSASPRSIQGFGLEVATLTVVLPPEATAGERAVVLESDRGAPEPPTVTPGPPRLAEATLRSRGIGKVTVIARSSQLAPATIELDFQWPVAFLVAALLGAGLGTIAARAKARKRRAPGSVARSSAEAVSGFVVGLLTAVLYAIGVNVTGLQIETQYGEAVVLVLAALGAIYGLPGLSKAVPAVRRLSGGTSAPQ